MDVLYEYTSQHFALIVIKYHIKPCKHTDWYPFDVIYELVMRAILTWLQIAFHSRILHVMGCRVNSPCRIRQRCPHAATFTWSHVMWSSNIRQIHSLCFTVSSRTVFSRHRHYATNKQSREKPDVGSAIIQCQLLACKVEECDLSSLEMPQ